jgi:hypothetical protein
MGEFMRDRLPEPLTYYESEGLKFEGKGKWRTTECRFHGGSDSMRVNIQSGAFLCMAGCGARGGDVLAHHMAEHGLDFIAAAKALGAWEDNGAANRGTKRPTAVSARALLELVAFELTVCVMVLADTLNGCLKDDDFDRFREAVGRIRYVSEVANA